MERSHPQEPEGLEASLLQMINDHNSASSKLREQTEKSKREAIRTALRVSDLLVNAVNGGVQEVFIIEKRIEMEIRALAATVARFSKQTDQWLAASHTINTAVKVVYFQRLENVYPQGKGSCIREGGTLKCRGQPTSYAYQA